MRQIMQCLAVSLIAYSAAPVHARGDDNVRNAVFAEDAAQREAAIAALRREGPQSLEALFDMRTRLVSVAQSAPEEAKRSVALWSLRRIDQAIDRVGGQRYCNASKLYWYTDLAAAKAAAEREGKPILSLRMLGNLTDEYSCANSRFFRTTLYANAEISKTLREKFVLHWKSVRPVPVVTIDFGDGRTLKRTLTGNSAHYVLAADGRPLDALPGLYHPKAFAEWLATDEKLAHEYAAAKPEERDALVAAHHAERLEKVLADWRSDLVKIGAAKKPETVRQVAQQAGPPKAKVAMLEARTKGRIEAPILQAVAANEVASEPADLQQLGSEEQWPQLAMLHRYQVDLDDASVALIRSELPADVSAGRIIKALEESIGIDTIRNEYRLHTRIHQWFARGEAGVDAGALNERIYSELFLTPSSDPWLGLAPSDVYTALGNGGIVQAP